VRPWAAFTGAVSLARDVLTFAGYAALLASLGPWAIVALVVFFAVGIVLLRRVDMRTGVVAAGNEVPAVL
jgi:hypothetical protein